MESGRLTKLASIAEILSSVAVVVTLVFIVIEIRQNNSLIEQNSRAIRESAIQGLDTGVMDIVNLFSGTEDRAVLIARAADAYDELTEGQQIHYRSLMNAGYLRMDISWWAHQNGLLPDGLWEREEAVLRRWVNSEGGRIAWRTANVSRDFREFVDGTLIEAQ